VQSLAKQGHLSEADRRRLLVDAWANYVEQHLDAEGLAAETEKRLIHYKENFNLTQDDLDHNGAFTRVVKAAILRDLHNGIVPSRTTIQGGPTLNLQKDEKIVWEFAGSSLLEDKVSHHYVGGSNGVSVRLAKGLYYRTSSFKGRQVDVTNRVVVDHGTLVVSNKCIYFAGSHKSLKIPYKKIGSFTNFSNGIGIAKDTGGGKLQIFVTGDGWFSCNLIAGLARIATET
jgi:hypothetical protein